jgi:hypothetical protein
MATKSAPPRPIGEIIDRIEQIREELLTLQRALEKTESVAPTIVPEVAE